MIVSKTIQGLIGATVLCLLASASALADAYADARAELIANYEAGDYAAMRLAAESALTIRPGYPGARFNRALAEALDGDSTAALATLIGLAESDIDFAVAEVEEFASLRALAAWPKYEQTIAALHEPVGNAAVAYSYDVADFVPEGIAIGNDGVLYLGSIRHGTIVKVTDSGNAEELSNASAHWSVFGMRLDGAGGLWFASAATPEFADSTEESAGRTGLFRMQLSSGDITHRALLPPADEPLVFGDLVIVDDDTILATESLTGVLYRYSISQQEFSELVPAGILRSMQGLVLDASGRYAYVADYVGGLFRVDLVDNSIARVSSDESVSLFGIDGLYRHQNELVAIQNGIRPHRVVALSLSESGLAITDSRVLARNLAEFDEPTLGQVVGDDFYLVANSHWNRFDGDGELPDGLSGPIVLKLSLQ